MKIFCIFSIALLLFGCNNDKQKVINPEAVKYNNEALRIVINNHSSGDSLKYAIELINKAIELVPEEDFYRAQKVHFYLDYGERRLAKEASLENWRLSKKNHKIALLIGALYEDNNQLDSAKVYYTEALVSVNSNKKLETDIETKIEKKIIELMLYGSVDFSDLDSAVNNHEYSDILKRIIDKFKSGNRKELRELLIKGTSNN